MSGWRVISEPDPFLCSDLIDSFFGLMELFFCSFIQQLCVYFFSFSLQIVFVGESFSPITFLLFSCPCVAGPSIGFVVFPFRFGVSEG